MYSLEAFRVKKILHSTMKENNYSLILRTIFHNRSIERVNLVKETLLSPSTITRCVAQLVDDDVIIETNPSQYGKIGRRALNLEINPNALKVLLVDIGAQRINYAIGKANGDIEKLEYSKTPKKFENILEEMVFHAWLSGRYRCRCVFSAGMVNGKQIRYSLSRVLDGEI